MAKPLKSLTKKQLLNKVRKSFVGITKDFTKDDLIYNLSKLPEYAKSKKTTKTKSQKPISKRPTKRTTKDTSPTRQRKERAKPTAKDTQFLDTAKQRISTKKDKSTHRGKAGNLKTEKIRGKNTFTIKGRGKAENLAARISKDGLKKDLQYYLTKNKPIKNRPPKEPKAIVVISKVKTSEGEIKTFSEISDPDFRVTEESALEFIESRTSGAGDIFEDLYGEEIDSILNVSVKFIY